MSKSRTVLIALIAALFSFSLPTNAAMTALEYSIDQPAIYNKAVQGEPNAQAIMAGTIVGNFIYNKKYSKEALEWAIKSYKQNNMQGAYQLSRIYAYVGSEDLLDGQKAITLATEVLDNGGSIKAAQVLMSIYGQGNIVVKDVRKAAGWFLIYISLAQVDGAKKAHIEHINKKFDGLTKDFTDSEYDYAVNFANNRIPAMRKARLKYKKSKEFIAYNQIQSLRISTSN